MTKTQINAEMKKYQIIYADPPWQLQSDVLSRTCKKHYPTMTIEAIKDLQLPKEDDSVLFLWATAPMLIQGLEVLSAWGFEYKTHLIWDKEIIGCGWWFRGRHELLLVGVCGTFSPPPNNKRADSVYCSKRTKHSRKPPIIRHWINQWYPNCSKLELFARKENLLFDADCFDGWDVWGNEVKSDIELK